MYNSNNSKICRSYHRTIDVLTDTQIGSLYTFEIIALICNLFFNCIAICSIIKTQQFRITYIRTTMYLCISYILVSIISQPYMVYHFYTNNTDIHHCSKNIQTSMAILFFPTVSIYIIFIMVYDCHKNVKDHHKYMDKFTIKQTFMHLAYILIVSFIQDLTIGIAAAIDIQTILTMLVIPFDIVLYLIVTVMHIKTVLMYKRKKDDPEHQQQQSEDNFNIVETWKLKLVTIYLISIVVFRAPRFLTDTIDLVMHDKETPSNSVAFAVMILLIFANCCGAFNAAAFIVLNEASCQFCKKNLRKLKIKLFPEKKNKVDGSNPNLQERKDTASTASTNS